MRHAILALVLTAGCGNAVADVPFKPVLALNPDASLVGEARAEMIFDGAHGTTRAVRVAQGIVDQWDETSRQEARSAARLLMGSCPYNRASVQIPVVLQMVLARHDADTVDVEVRAEWRRLQVGLAEHVALLDAYAVTDLVVPEPGEYLYDHPSVIRTRAQLQSSPDPIAETQVLVDQITPLVEGYDVMTAEFIEMARLRLVENSREQWPHKELVSGWRASLVSIAPHLRDEATRNEVQALITLLEGWSGQGC